jgi:hypothetical protein
MKLRERRWGQQFDDEMINGGKDIKQEDFLEERV